MLGRGGMGHVFRAEHLRMARTVAVKVLSAELTRKPGAIERFHREVKAAARLTHPRIVTAHDADEFNGTHCLVMERVEGTDLHSVVRKQGPLPVASAVPYIQQAAEGLECVHASGIIHRDIKPSNLLLGSEISNRYVPHYPTTNVTLRCTTRFAMLTHVLFDRRPKCLSDWWRNSITNLSSTRP